MAKFVLPKHVDLPPELQDALLDCDGDTIVALLEQHPEWSHTKFTFEARDQASAKEITGGLMAAAVRLGGHHVVDLLEVLVECGIGFEICTSFYAGSSRALDYSNMVEEMY
eukprot:symbB.v1.2.023359.t1/scaffold2133.1/size88229/4